MLMSHSVRIIEVAYHQYCALPQMRGIATAGSRENVGESRNRCPFVISRHEHIFANDVSRERTRHVLVTPFPRYSNSVPMTFDIRVVSRP